MLTFGYLADPFVFSVTELWHESIGHVTVHSAEPPVIILSFILDKGRHHLHENTHQATRRPQIISTDKYDTTHSNLRTYRGTVRPLPTSWMLRVSLIQAHPEQATLCSKNKQTSETKNLAQLVFILFMYCVELNSNK